MQAQNMYIPYQNGGTEGNLGGINGPA
jgi:hypothetical protein